MILSFPPEFSIDLQGQIYVPTGRAGAFPDSIEWLTSCPDCGTEFLVTTGMTFRYPNRRCANCKSPGKKVRRSATRRANA